MTRRRRDPAEDEARLLEYVRGVNATIGPLSEAALADLERLLDSSGGYAQDHPDVRSNSVGANAERRGHVC